MPKFFAALTSPRSAPAWRALSLLLPLMAALLLYYPALSFGKVWDDWYLLGDFGRYLDPAMWKQVLALPLPFSENYFRPLVMVTFVLEGYLATGDAVSHLINILLQGLNGVLLSLLALRVLPPVHYRRAVALVIGVAYVVVPPLSEAVIWLSGRFDLMVVTMMLLGLLADSTVKRPLYRHVLVGLAFVAALFCKEMGAVMPAALLALRAARSREALPAFLFARAQLGLYAALAGGAFVYVAVRYAALGYMMTTIPQMQYVDLGGALNRVLLAGLSFAGYLHMLLLPFTGINPVHFAAFPILPDNALAWTGLAEMAVLVALLAWLICLPRWRAGALLFAAALLSLAPVLHLTPVPMVLANMWMADRALALPLALFLLAGAMLFVSLIQVRYLHLASVVAAAWLLLSVMLVRSVTPLWINDLVLWNWAVQESPACSPCHSNYSTYLLLTFPAEMALAEADLAIKTAAQPWQTGQAYSARAQALRKMGQYEEALTALVAAQEADPAVNMKIQYELQRAGLLMEMKRMDAAQNAIGHAVAMGGGQRIEAMVLVAELALQADRPDVARALYQVAYANASQKVLAAKLKRTDDPARWARLSDMFNARGEQENAIAAAAEYKRLRALKKAAEDAGK